MKNRQFLSIFVMHMSFKVNIRIEACLKQDAVIKQKSLECALIKLKLIKICDVIN